MVLLSSDAPQGIRAPGKRIRPVNYSSSDYSSDLSRHSSNSLHYSFNPSSKGGCSDMFKSPSGSSTWFPGIPYPSEVVESAKGSCTPRPARWRRVLPPYLDSMVPRDALAQEGRSRGRTAHTERVRQIVPRRAEQDTFNTPGRNVVRRFSINNRMKDPRQ